MQITSKSDSLARLINEYWCKENIRFNPPIRNGRPIYYSSVKFTIENDSDQLKIEDHDYYEYVELICTEDYVITLSQNHTNFSNGFPFVYDIKEKLQMEQIIPKEFQDNHTLYSHILKLLTDFQNRRHYVKSGQFYVSIVRI